LYCQYDVVAASLIIAVSIHFHYAEEEMGDSGDDESALFPQSKVTATFQTTTFMTSSAAGIAASVCLILGML
jgi:hypothetical protein